MRPRGLSPAQQAFALHARFPDAKGTLKRGRLVWTGVIQPTPLSRTYRIQMDYQPPRPPSVRVLDRLATRPGDSLPHTYSNGTLCLHEPEEWTYSMYIANTILPWTAEWLINYEIWLPTGDWHGGGEWPPLRNVPEKPRRQD